MNSKDTYIENRIQNTFTAYLLKSVRGVRQSYLARKNRVIAHEGYLEDMPVPDQPSYSFEEHMNHFPGANKPFDDLESDKLFKAVMWLKDTEREIIYQHIFEEKTFSEIAWNLQLSEAVIKGHYYYALTKIRNRMRGEGA